jgi:hypothetical protein
VYLRYGLHQRDERLDALGHLSARYGAYDPALHRARAKIGVEPVRWRLRLRSAIVEFAHPWPSGIRKGSLCDAYNAWHGHDHKQLSAGDRHGPILKGVSGYRRGSCPHLASPARMKPSLLATTH